MPDRRNVAEKAKLAALGVDADYSKCERQDGGGVLAPTELTIPINGEPTQSFHGDGLLVCCLGTPPQMIIVAAGISGSCGFHLGMSADEARNAGTALLRAADHLDSGGGKQ